VSPERARAVIEVEPNHAACYWQAISATLKQLGAQHAHLEISVVDVPRSAGEPNSPLVLLEMSSADLDQPTLDAAVRETSLECGGNAHQPGLQAAAGMTVSWPLDARFDQTIEAPLRPSPDASNA
jgi:hypothetical protein